MAPTLHHTTGRSAPENEQRPALKADDVLDLSEIGMKVHVRKDRAQTGGRSFDVEMLLQPHAGGTPIHIHPQASETYEVLEGKLEVYVNGAWKTLAAGEKMTVERGVPHTIRNAGSEVARVYDSHQPAMRYDEFFVGLSQVANSGVVKGGKMSFKALLALAALWTSFENEIRSVRPPHLVMRVLGRLDRLLGYRFS